MITIDANTITPPSQPSEAEILRTLTDLQRQVDERRERENRPRTGGWYDLITDIPETRPMVAYTDDEGRTRLRYAEDGEAD